MKKWFFMFDGCWLIVDPIRIVEGHVSRVAQSAALHEAGHGGHGRSGIVVGIALPLIKVDFGFAVHGVGRFA